MVGIRNPEGWNPESKTPLDSVTWGENLLAVLSTNHDLFLFTFDDHMLLILILIHCFVVSSFAPCSHLHKINNFEHAASHTLKNYINTAYILLSFPCVAGGYIGDTRASERAEQQSREMLARAQSATSAV